MFHLLTFLNSCILETIINNLQVNSAQTWLKSLIPGQRRSPISEWLSLDTEGPDSVTPLFQPAGFNTWDAIETLSYYTYSCSEHTRVGIVSRSNNFIETAANSNK